MMTHKEDRLSAKMHYIVAATDNKVGKYLEASTWFEVNKLETFGVNRVGIEEQ